MHCDGACTSEIALVGMVEADAWATGHKLERSPRSEFLGGGVDAKSIAAAEALRSVAHERAALDARNEFWAGWATQRGFPPPAGSSRGGRWRAVKFANVDWAIKPYLSGYEAHDPGRAAAELAAAKALKEGAPPDAVEAAVKSAMKAAEAAEKYGWDASRTVGSAVASDAFFPFADGLLAAAEAGATAIIQPGGSIRDEEVIAAADANDLAMVFTGMRHFRH